MYTIGEVSKMVNLPISTLRYYDKEGLFPNMMRTSGIRKFTENELKAIEIIECLKKSGLEIKEIKQFIEWCQQGKDTYELRYNLFLKQKKVMEAEIEQMNKTLEMLKFKCWYYEQAINDGNEERLKKMPLKEIPEDIRNAYLKINE